LGETKGFQGASVRGSRKSQDWGGEVPGGNLQGSRRWMGSTEKRTGHLGGKIAGGGEENRKLL